MIRPSGTEPVLRTYQSPSREIALKILESAQVKFFRHAIIILAILIANSCFSSNTFF